MKMRSLDRSETLYQLVNIGMLDKYRKRIDNQGHGESILIDTLKGVRGTVTVDGVTRDNLILANFGTYWFGILLDTNLSPVRAYDVTGEVTLRTMGDVNADAFTVMIGSGTSPPAMTDFDLVNRVSLTTARSISNQETETIIVGSAVSDRSFTEVGIRQGLVDTVGGVKNYLLARSLMSGGANTSIVYRIRFQYPWVRNMGYIMYGLLTDSNISVTDIGGTSFTARTSADMNAGSVYLVGSSQGVTWNPDISRLQNPFTISTATYYYNPRTFVLLILVGSISPSTDTELRVIGLQQAVYDVSTQTRHVLLGCIPLPNPIVLRANRVNFVFLRILLA